MLAPDAVVRLSGDMYRMHRRPGYAHLVINDDYQGIKIIDPLNDLLVGTRLFLEQYSSSGVIDNWFFSADGNNVLTVCEEDRSAALIDLVHKEASGIVEYPPISTMSNLAYIWKDTFVFSTGLVSSYFSLQKHDHIWKFVEQRSIDIRIKYPGWRRGLDRLPAHGCSMHRIDSSLGSLIYHDHLSSPQRIGVVCWNDDDDWSVPVSDNISRCSSDGRSLFLLQEHRLDILNNHGESLTSIPSPSGFHFWDVDVIPGDETRPTALFILSSSIQENSAQLLGYFNPSQ